jgi:hypothetical protein
VDDKRKDLEEQEKRIQNLNDQAEQIRKELSEKDELIQNLQVQAALKEKEKSKEREKNKILRQRMEQLKAELSHQKEEFRKENQVGKDKVNEENQSELKKENAVGGKEKHSTEKDGNPNTQRKDDVQEKLEQDNSRNLRKQFAQDENFSKRRSCICKKEISS